MVMLPMLRKGEIKSTRSGDGAYERSQHFVSLRVCVLRCAAALFPLFSILADRAHAANLLPDETFVERDSGKERYRFVQRANDLMDEIAAIADVYVSLADDQSRLRAEAPYLAEQRAELKIRIRSFEANFESAPTRSTGAYMRELETIVLRFRDELGVMSQAMTRLGEMSLSDLSGLAEAATSIPRFPSRALRLEIAQQIVIQMAFAPDAPEVKIVEAMKQGNALGAAFMDMRSAAASLSQTGSNQAIANMEALRTSVMAALDDAERVTLRAERRMMSLPDYARRDADKLRACREAILVERKIASTLDLYVDAARKISAAPGSHEAKAAVSLANESRLALLDERHTALRKINFANGFYKY